MRSPSNEGGVMGRKYRLIRLSAGDYLLPGNDGETIFRIAKYLEDGTLEGVAEGAEFWAAWRWPKPKNTLRGDYDYDPFEDWESWYQIEDLFKTRQEAIDVALMWGWRRDNPVHGPDREPVDVGASIVAMFAKPI